MRNYKFDIVVHNRPILICRLLQFHGSRLNCDVRSAAVGKRRGLIAGECKTEGGNRRPGSKPRERHRRWCIKTQSGNAIRYKDKRRKKEHVSPPENARASITCRYIELTCIVKCIVTAVHRKSNVEHDDSRTNQINIQRLCPRLDTEINIEILTKIDFRSL